MPSAEGRSAGSEVLPLLLVLLHGVGAMTSGIDSGFAPLRGPYDTETAQIKRRPGLVPGTWVL